jgi:hypothetical protein
MPRAKVLKRKPSSHLTLCLSTAKHNTALALPEFRLNLVPFGFSTKIHLRCDGNRLPITFKLTVGERHEAVVFE